MPLAALAVSLLLARLPLRLSRAASFLRCLSGPSGPEPAVEQSEVSLALPGGPLRAKLFRPQGRSRVPGMLVVPGLHPLGIDDPRLLSFARAAAAAGFAAVAPDLRELTRFEVSPATVDAVEGALKALSRLPGVDPSRIGGLGVSYGAGPLLLAAARDGMVGKLAFLAAIGGYLDLGEVLRYGLTEPSSHPWSRLVFAVNHLAEICSSGDQEALGAALRAKLTLRDEESERAALRLSPAGLELFRALCGPGRPELEPLLARAGARFQELTRRMSPGSALGRLTSRIYLLHGYDDDVVPRSETLALAEALRRCGSPARAVLVTRAFSHVDARPAPLLERLRLLRFAYRFVGEAG